jgi:hypothetical protein
LFGKQKKKKKSNQVCKLTQPRVKVEAKISNFQNWFTLSPQRIPREKVPRNISSHGGEGRTQI